MNDWGHHMFVTPGVIVDGKLVTNNLVDINLGLRILLGHSFYEDWGDGGHEVFVTEDPLGNPIDIRHPWNQHTLPKPARRDFDAAYSWTMSPRWFDGADHLARTPGGGPIARLLVDGAVRARQHRLRQGHRPQRDHHPAPDGPQARGDVRVDDPQWSNAIERNRAGLLRAYTAALALHFVDKALTEVRAGRTETWTPFEVPEEAISVGFTEAVRGVLSHHLVIREGKIANYHPYPPTPWNGSVRDVYGTPGPYEDAVQNTPIFEENPPETFKGIDIMRRCGAGSARACPAGST